MEQLPGALERLTARLEVLERRVEALEHSAVVLTVPLTQETSGVEANEVIAGPAQFQAAGAFSVLGKSMLGIAGAYVLRAVAESSTLPQLAITAIAIAYAAIWLVVAARVKAGVWFVSSVYAGTSALILAPMLWELTLRFKVVPAPATAAILGVFVLAASALAWKQDLAPVFWVANLTAAVTSFALCIATHDLIPFIATLMLMALIAEYAAGRNHELSVRLLAAAAADLSIWALIFIYSGRESIRVDYPAIGVVGLLVPGCFLFLIYGTSIGIRSVLHGNTITLFETIQSLIAFLLAASSVLYFEPQWGGTVLGIFCLLLSASCYTAVFVRFDGAQQGRNYRVFAAWAAGLLLAGCALSLPPLGVAVSLGLAAVIATVQGIRLSRITLQFHGLVFLAAATIQSGLFVYAFHALAGSRPARLEWSALIASACAIACYAAGKPRHEGGWGQQFLRLSTAAFAVLASAALLVQILHWLISFRLAPEAHHLAFIRTFTACAAALALAFAGSRWRRVELTRIAYAALGLVAAKLVFEDLRNGHLEFIAASIFLFAITLIAVPRLARIGKRG